MIGFSQTCDTVLTKMVKNVAEVNGEFVVNNNAVTQVFFPKDEPLLAECQHFVECALHELKPRTDGEQGMRVLRVLDACQESLDQEGTIVSL